VLTEPDVEERFYYQAVVGDAGPNIYSRPSAAVQVRQSLARQRRAGVPFDTAYRQAVGKIAHEHEHLDRRCWQAVLADPAVIEIWRAAYERRPYHRALDTVGHMRTVMEEAEVVDAKHRVEHPQAA
jgi:hypothetical protein